jgi:hypothetical protein
MRRTKAVEAVIAKPYWREDDALLVVEAWRSSGQSVARFAALYGVDAQRIHRWVSRLGNTTSSACAIAEATFHPLRVIVSVRPSHVGRWRRLVDPVRDGVRRHGGQHCGTRLLSH